MSRKHVLYALVALSSIAGSVASQTCAPVTIPLGQPALIADMPVCVGVMPLPLPPGGNPGFALSTFVPAAPAGSPTYLIGTRAIRFDRDARASRSNRGAATVGEGFEPPDALASPVYKTGAFSLSAIPPRESGSPGQSASRTSRATNTGARSWTDKAIASDGRQSTIFSSPSRVSTRHA